MTTPGDTAGNDSESAEIRPEDGQEVDVSGTGTEAATSEAATEAAETTNEAQSRSGWLLLAAIAVIAIPVLVGYLFMRSDDSSSAADVGGGAATADQGMGGGGMGGSEPVADVDVVVARPEGVGDFAAIQATDIVIEPDPAGGGAVLRVTTTEEVACAVSYGPTVSLGLMATDTDMAGGGHTDHQPLMQGLVAGSTYWYQVSAIGPDGRLYQSELMSFDYDAEASGPPAVQPPAPNVADMASVKGVSSEFSDAYGGRNAIDGDLATEWSSAGDGDDAFIVLDFGEDMQIEGVGFRTRSMTDGTSITTSYTVTIDGRTYGPFDAGPGLSVGLLDELGGVVRFDVETSTGGNTGAIEVEVYGQPDM